jgi:hypothetical protein
MELASIPLVLYIAELFLVVLLCLYLVKGLHRRCRQRSHLFGRFFLLACVLAAQAARLAVLFKHLALTIQPSYAIYDSSTSAIARWWMPAKVTRALWHYYR